MTDHPPREHPQNTTQAISEAATGVISGLRSQPAMLALVVLVIVATSLNYWFMRGLISEQHARSLALMQTMDKTWSNCLALLEGELGQRESPLQRNLREQREREERLQDKSGVGEPSKKADFEAGR